MREDKVFRLAVEKNEDSSPKGEAESSEKDKDKDEKYKVFRIEDVLPAEGGDIPTFIPL